MITSSPSGTNPSDHTGPTLLDLDTAIRARLHAISDAERGVDRAIGRWREAVTGTRMTDGAGAAIAVDDDGVITPLPAVPGPTPTAADELVLAQAALGLGTALSCVTPPPEPRTPEPVLTSGAAARKKLSAKAVAAGRRTNRMNLRDLIQEVTSLSTVRACEKAVLESGVSIRKEKDGPAGFAGVVRCASVWACPTCSAVIRSRRAAELGRLALGWIELDEDPITGRRTGGHGLAMATLTTRHWQFAKLAHQMAGVADAWRRVTRGEPWNRFKRRFGLAGVTRAVEITRGDNGWHTHLHVLLWFETGLDEEADHARAAEVQQWLYERWCKMLKQEKLGVPSLDHGVRVDPARLIRETGPDGKTTTKLDGAIAEYLVKLQEKPGKIDGPQVGNEIARGDMKTNQKNSRTPFEIVADHFKDGNKRDLAWWGEYERATKGRRMLTWSKDLKKRLAAEANLDLDETDNGDLVAAEESTGTELAYVPAQPWRRSIARIPGRRASLIHAADAAGTDGIRQLIESWGLTWGIDVLAPNQAPSQEERQLTRERALERRKAKSPGGWKNSDELQWVSAVTGLSPRDAVRPAQAARRHKGLTIDRDLDKAVAVLEASAYTGPTCAGCHTPLAASLVDTGRHVMC
ncbi:protein rep [Embleya sp. NPDC059237]|uniref:protein rep n=1 Tax=Embleya sp. NPDC059237 TaxID=3346784 RepID=UPI003688423A